MAKLDMSEFFAPLEARWSARVAELEARMDRRLGAIERLAGACAGAASPARDAYGDLGGSQHQPDGWRESMLARLQQTDELVASLVQKVHECQDDHASTNGVISDLRQQVSRDRQETFDSMRDFSETLEAQLKKLYEKVEMALMPAADASDESALDGSLGSDPSSATRWCSSPKATVLLGRQRSLSPVGRAPEALKPPVEAEEVSEHVPIQRWCSVPVTALASRRPLAPQQRQQPQQTQRQPLTQSKPQQQLAPPTQQRSVQGPPGGVIRSPTAQPRASMTPQGSHVPSPTAPPRVLGVGGAGWQGGGGMPQRMQPGLRQNASAHSLRGPV